MIGYRKTWLRIAKLGDLPPDVTPHVLRHSFASLAADEPRRVCRRLFGLSHATMANPSACA
jgi:integrase